MRTQHGRPTQPGGGYHGPTRSAVRSGTVVPLTDDRPIGMFDSGFGGLTVARAVIDLLPDEDLVYVGDTGRYPYGPRPLDEVARLRPPDQPPPRRRARREAGDRRLQHRGGGRPRRAAGASCRCRCSA